MAEKLFGAFTKFLGSKESLKKYAGAMKAGKSIADKVDDIRGMDEAKTILIQAFAPLKIPFQIVATKLASQITKDVMELMQEGMESVQSDSFQKGVQYLTILIKLILNNTAAFLDWTQKINEQTNKWLDAIKKLYWGIRDMTAATNNAQLNLQNLTLQIIALNAAAGGGTTAPPLSTPLPYQIAPPADVGPPPTVVGGDGTIS